MIQYLIQPSFAWWSHFEPVVGLIAGDLDLLQVKAQARPAKATDRRVSGTILRLLQKFLMSWILSNFSFLFLDLPVRRALQDDGPDLVLGAHCSKILVPRTVKLWRGSRSEAINQVTDDLTSHASAGVYRQYRTVFTCARKLRSAFGNAINHCLLHKPP